MNNITPELLKKTISIIGNDPQFRHDCRALDAVVKFRENDEGVCINIRRGDVSLANTDTDADFIISATADNWYRVFTEADPRFGIYELKGAIIDFEGNDYIFAGNAKAFYSLWLALREAWEEMHGIQAQKKRADDYEEKFALVNVPQDQKAEIIGRYIQIGPYRTYYESAGEGKPVICLPTAGASSGEFRHILEYFGMRGYRMIALDPPGHGKSYPDFRTNRILKTEDEYVDFAWQFAKTLGFEKPAFIGYAVAGSAVLLLAAKYGDEISAVVAGEGNTKLSIDPIQLLSLNHPSINMSDLMEVTTPGLCGQGLPDEVVNECIWHNARSPVPEVIEADLTIYDNHDVTDRLSEIRCPVLHIWGDRDYCVTQESKQLILENIPVVRQVELRNTGHYVPMENPSGLIREIEKFFEEFYPAK